MGAKVSFEGDGPVKTVKITGENLNRNKIILALGAPGFGRSRRSDSQD